MEIRLSYHARKRMLERGIKFEQIRETLEMPEYSIVKESKKELYKKINNKILKVVCVEKDNYINVITLMWK